jgi:hypothetical protein
MTRAATPTAIRIPLLSALAVVAEEVAKEAMVVVVAVAALVLVLAIAVLVAIVAAAAAAVVVAIHPLHTLDSICTRR